MKTLGKFLILAALIISVSSLRAQLLSASSGTAKTKVDKNVPASDRQKDIVLLEERAKTVEQEFSVGNFDAFNEHKTAVLQIMDREISRSDYDFDDLKNQLQGLDPDSQEGRALRLQIMQMDGRDKRQKYIRDQIAGFTVNDIHVENSKSLAGMKSLYFQFIRNMKTNLKDIEGIVLPADNPPTRPGTSNATSSGANTNNFSHSSQQKK
jgi:hypothetical protein